MSRKKGGKGTEEVRRGDIPVLPPPEMKAIKKALAPMLERARETAKFLRQAGKPYPNIDTTELDRAMGWEIYGPQRLARKPSRKKKRPVGRPRDYDRDAIQDAGRDYLANVGRPPTLVLFCEKVRDACNQTQPRIFVPEDRHLQSLLRPVYRGPHKRTN